MSSPSVLTRRSLVAGGLIVVAGAWAGQRVELVYGGPELGAGALAALPVLALAGLAACCTRLPGPLRLSPAELVGVYLMAAAGLPLATSGFVHHLLPGLVTGFYGSFADPAGRYAPFLPHIPRWMVPGGPGDGAVAGFFEGSVTVPWRSWAVPLAAWSLLAAGLAAASWGLAALLRQRWLEEERLRLPLAEVPASLLESGGHLLRDPRLLAGALVPVVVYGVNGIEHYFLAPGAIPTGFDLGEVLVDSPWRAMAPFTSPFRFELSPLLVGLAFLMSVEVTFSTWFFYLVTRLQLLVVEMLGRTGDSGTFVGLGGQWREWPNFLPHLQAQARGGLMCLAALCLWAARSSLTRSWRRAVTASGPERGWVCGLAGGAAVLTAWGIAAGLPPLLSAGHTAVLLLTAVGVARLRLDGGLPMAGLFLLIPNLFYFAGGTGPGAFPPSAYVAFAFLALLSYGSLALWLILQLEGERLARGAGGRNPVPALAAGTAIGLAAGCVFALSLVYDRGLFALDQDGGARSAARVGRYVQYLYAEAGGQRGDPDTDRLAAVGVGAAVTAALSWARLWFLRSPFHPAGFVYGTGLGGLLWGSALVGWAVKVLVVRYGGAGTYRRLRPFFLGLIVGELFMKALWAAAAPAGAPGSGYDW